MTNIKALTSSYGVTYGTGAASFVSMQDGSKFDINHNYILDFFGGYNEVVSKNLKECTSEQVGAGVCESLLNSRASPVIGTFLFRFRDLPGGGNNSLTEEFIKDLVRAYQMALTRLLDITPSARELYCAVLETAPWSKEQGIQCLEVQLRFPYCHVNKDFQRKNITHQVIDNLRSINPLSKLKVQYQGDWDKCITPLEDSVALYGSPLSKGHPVPLLTHIYAPISDESSDEDADTELSKVFDPKDHPYMEDKNQEEGDPEQWISLFLSCFLCRQITPPKQISTKKEENFSSQEFSSSKCPMEMARSLLPMVGQHRYADENYWKDIGKALYNIFEGEQEGLDIWKSISKKGSNTSPSRCFDEYHKFREDNNLTVKTIGFYARLDSPDLYAKWLKDWTRPAFEKAADCTDEDLAEAVYRYFWLDYFCSDTIKNKWWYWPSKGNRLIPMNGAVHIRTGITEHIIPYFERVAADVTKEVGTNYSKPGEKKSLENELITLGKVIKRFKTSSSKNNVITMCKDKFYVEDFDKKLNSSTTTTAFGNCVVEICGNLAVPRPGKPEDYISKGSNVYYQNNFSWTHRTVTDFMSYLEKVFPDPELRHFALKDFASYLLGANLEKKIRVWIGRGDNSKSIFLKIIQAWLGDHAIDFPAGMFCSSSKGSGPTPELDQARDAHVATVCEPDTDETKAAFFKRVSGMDRAFSRGCNENGSSFEQKFKIIYMCNDMPPISGADKAAMDRFWFFTFVSKWIDTNSEEWEPYKGNDEKQKEDNVYPMDRKFVRFIPDFAQALFWVAVQMYPTYAEEGMGSIPVCMKRHAANHWKNNDPYEKFLQQYIKKAKYIDGDALTDRNSITTTDAYTAFKAMFLELFPRSQIVSSGNFITQLSNRIGTQVGSRWKGFVAVS